MLELEIKEPVDVDSAVTEVMEEGVQAGLALVPIYVLDTSSRSLHGTPCVYVKI